MNTLEAIFSRKSVRKFTGMVTDEELNTIVKAAYAAPVGRAMYQNMHLTVITNKELLDKIDKAGAALFNNPNIHPLYEAPVLIIVSTKPSGFSPNVDYSNCACIVQNMALAAVELGLGACHIWGAVDALNRNAELMKKLGLPEGFTPCCGLILGKTDVEYTRREIPDNRIPTTYLS